MNILILKEEFGSLILSGKKTWELRGQNTKKRERISIAYSGTGKKYGEVDIIDAMPLTKELFEKNRNKHCSKGSWENLIERYKTPYAWVMKNQGFYKNPKKYFHPNGAIIWVREE
jgi:hypothetical protein